MGRMAVLVGCNYPDGPDSMKLQGCINDVRAMRQLLETRFGFERSHIKVLTDEPDPKVRPTGANIKKELARMVNQAVSGDVLFFYFSGHGTRFPSGKSFDYPFRRHEAIVPCDYNYIVDVDFRDLVNRVPKGASFTILSDSCFSGHLIEKEKEQIGSCSHHSVSSTSLASGSSKMIPFEAILQRLESLDSIAATDPVAPDFATRMLNWFGEDASLLFHATSVRTWDRLDGDEDAGILLSGCQENETSLEIEDEGKYYGALSCAVRAVLKKHPDKISNKQLVTLARKTLKAWKAEGKYLTLECEQNPCLYCSDKSADAAFLRQPARLPWHLRS